MRVGGRFRGPMRLRAMTLRDFDDLERARLHLGARIVPQSADRAAGVRPRQDAVLQRSGRGVPFGPDDSTLSPWAVAASLPFAPDIVIPALSDLERTHLEITGAFGYKCSYNETFMERGQGKQGWVSQGFYAIDQGPVVLMIENHRSEFVWKLMRPCPYVINGMRAAGFEGGWVSGETASNSSASTRRITVSADRRGRRGTPAACRDLPRRDACSHHG